LGVRAVAIHRLLRAGSFGPDQITVIVAAYDRALEALHLKPDRYATANEVVARKIIQIAHTGATDPEVIAAQVVLEVQLPPT
jgi:hypothetical protein